MKMKNVYVSFEELNSENLISKTPFPNSKIRQLEFRYLIRINSYHSCTAHAANTAKARYVSVNIARNKGFNRKMAVYWLMVSEANHAKQINSISLVTLETHPYRNNWITKRSTRRMRMATELRTFQVNVLATNLSMRMGDKTLKWSWIHRASGYIRDIITSSYRVYLYKDSVHVWTT